MDGASSAIGSLPAGAAADAELVPEPGRASAISGREGQNPSSPAGMGLKIEAGAGERSPLKEARAIVPGWLGSFLLHVTAIVCLAIVTRTVHSPTGIDLVADASGGDGGVMLDVVLSGGQVSSSRADGERLDQTEIQLPDAATIAPAVSAADLAMDSVWKATGSADALWGTSSGIGVERVLAAPDTGEKSGEGEDGANFFGVSARGQKFIFVIDCSGSMGGPRWLTARSELIRSIRSLKPDQEFAIMLYSSMSWSLQGSINEAAFVRATPENLDSASIWLGKQIPGGGTLPLPAVRQAISLHPDAIFLLSDGELQDDTRGYLWRYNREKARYGQVRVHTVGVGMFAGAQLLALIAAENGGEFHQVF